MYLDWLRGLFVSTKLRTCDLREQLAKVSSLAIAQSEHWSCDTVKTGLGKDKVKDFSRFYVKVKVQFAREVGNCELIGKTGKIRIGKWLVLKEILAFLALLEALWLQNQGLEEVTTVTLIGLEVPTLRVHGEPPLKASCQGDQRTLEVQKR